MLLNSWITNHKPVDAYFLATGLSVAPQIAGGAAQQGVTPFAMFLGPSYNDAFVAEVSAVKGLFESGLIYAMSFGVAPYEADTVGHQTMRATLSQITDSASTFFVGGWASQYNLKGVLEAAVKVEILQKLESEEQLLTLLLALMA